MHAFAGIILESDTVIAQYDGQRVNWKLFMHNIAEVSGNWLGMLRWPLGIFTAIASIKVHILFRNIIIRCITFVFFQIITLVMPGYYITVQCLALWNWLT